MSELAVETAYGPPLPDGLDRTTLKSALQAVLADQGVAGRVTCILTDDATLRHLNGDFRGRDTPTDVLTFDLRDPVHPAEDEIGEIYISLDRARIQAEDAGRPLQEEVTHLTIHGILHLLGFEHNTDAGHVRMRNREIHYLAWVKARQNRTSRGDGNVV